MPDLKSFAGKGCPRHLSICEWAPKVLNQRHSQEGTGSLRLKGFSFMAVVLDLLNQDQRPRHPEKAHRPDQPVQQRKPDWIRVKAPGSPKWAETNRIVRENKLVTVCEEAGCPNIGECWEKKHATFMIMGDTCTRACAFCNVKTGLPQALDPDEPESVGEGGREARPRARRHHLRRPRRPADGGARAFRRRDPRHPRPLAEDHDRDPDAGLPAQGRRPRDRRRGQARRVQPQPRDGAVEVPEGAARRALLPLDPPAAAGEGDRSDDLHQVRHHGRARRGAERGAAAHGRPALRRCGFPHHRPVPAADEEAPSGRSAS